MYGFHDIKQPIIDNTNSSFSYFWSSFVDLSGSKHGCLAQAWLVVNAIKLASESPKIFVITKYLNHF